MYPLDRPAGLQQYRKFLQGFLVLGGDIARDDTATQKRLRILLISSGC